MYLIINRGIVKNLWHLLLLVLIIVVIVSPTVAMHDVAPANSNQNQPSQLTSTIRTFGSIEYQLTNLPSSFLVGQEVLLTLRLVNIGTESQQVAVTIPQLNGKLISTPTPPQKEAPRWSVGPGVTAELTLPWLPAAEGYTQAVLDLWTATASAGVWAYAGRLAELVRVYPKDVRQIGVDAAHRNEIAGSATYNELRGTDLWPHLITEQWSASDIEKLAVLWVDRPDSIQGTAVKLLSHQEMTLAAAHVANGGALVVTGGSYADSPDQVGVQVNLLLAAVGAHTRISGDPIGTAASDGQRTTTTQVALSPLPDGLQPLLLTNASPLLIDNQATEILLLEQTTTGIPAVLGVLEPVGKGWVAIFGAPLSGLDQASASLYDNTAFIQALSGWLAEKQSK